MKKRLFFLAFLVCMIVGISFAYVKNIESNKCDQAYSACGKCGDGKCVKQCGENAISCPRDCGGSPSVAVVSE
jgi:hypothetical protein